jgi:hypothetical protein
LAYLQTTFALLAEGRPLPESLHAQLSEGEALHRAARLRESLKPHG